MSQTLPAVRGKRDHIAPPAECAKLIAAPQKRDRALWATAMYAGLRRGELQALRTEDIDVQAAVIHVRHGWDQVEGAITPKSGKARQVPIAAALRVHRASGRRMSTERGPVGNPLADAGPALDGPVAWSRPTTTSLARCVCKLACATWTRPQGTPGGCNVMRA